MHTCSVHRRTVSKSKSKMWHLAAFSNSRSSSSMWSADMDEGSLRWQALKYPEILQSDCRNVVLKPGLHFKATLQLLAVHATRTTPGHFGHEAEGDAVRTACRRSGRGLTQRPQTDATRGEQGLDVQLCTADHAHMHSERGRHGHTCLICHVTTVPWRCRLVEMSQNLRVCRSRKSHWKLQSGSNV